MNTAVPWEGAPSQGMNLGEERSGPMPANEDKSCLVPRTHIPTQRATETWRGLAADQRSHGQCKGNFQTQPRCLAASSEMARIRAIYMHTHNRAPSHPRLILRPPLNSDFKLLARFFSQHEAETFY